MSAGHGQEAISGRQARDRQESHNKGKQKRRKPRGQKDASKKASKRGEDRGLKDDRHGLLPVGKQYHG